MKSEEASGPRWAAALGLCLLALGPASQGVAASRSKTPPPGVVKEQPKPPAKVVRRTTGPTLAISLADAVFIGLRKNTTIRSAYVQRVAQIFDLKVAEDVFTPHGTLNASVLRQTTAGVPTDTVDVAPSVQALTPIGTVFSFAWDNNASHSPGQSAASTNLTANVTQPLLQGAGLDVNLAPVRSARLSEDINQLNLRQTVSQAITDIITAYRALMSSQEAEKLAEDGVTRAQALIDVDQALIQAGRLARMEIVQAEADLENQKLGVLQSQSQVDAARLTLAVLLDVDLATDFVLRDKLEARPTSILADEALKIALKFRPDYLVALDALEQAKLGITVADNQRLWNVSLVGSATLGRSLQVTSGARPVVSRVADGSLGLQVSGPINDLAPEQSYIHATTSFQGTEIQLAVTRQTVEEQVRLSAANIDLNWRQVESARRVVTLAANAVDIEKQKLQAGKSSVFQVQSLEASYRAALVQSLDAEVAYVNSLTQFDLQLGTTLKTWQVSLAGQ